MDERWEQIHFSREWGKYPSIDVVSFIAKNYYSANRAECKILDYGCGQGSNTWFLAKEGFDTYAFDGSESAIKKAKILLDKMNLKVDFKIMLGDKLDYKDNFFDCIIDGAVISANKVDNIKIMLKEIFRILKKDGKIISMGLFNSKTTGFGTGEFIEKNTYRNIETGTVQGIGTIHFFEKDEILNLWTEAGFKNITIDEEIKTRDNSTITTGSYIVTAQK